MTFDFTDDQYAMAAVMQKVFADAKTVASTRRWYDGPPPDEQEQRDLGRLLAEQGLLGAFIGEDLGGSGLHLLDVVMAVEACGQHLVPYPVADTLATAWALQRWGSESQRARHLPDVARGRSVPAVAWTALDGSVVARPRGGDWRLSGERVVVAFPGLTDLLLLPVAVEGAPWVGLVLVPVTELPLAFRTAWDRAHPVAALSVADIVVPQDSFMPLASSADRGDLAALGRILAAADILGAMDEVLRRTVAYLNTRRQFGGPIGRFQALKHRAAWNHTWTQNTRLAVRYAAWSFSQNSPRRAFYAGLAKAYASDHGISVAEDGVHLHGGMGFTWDSDLHLFLKRVWRLSAHIGTARECRQDMAVQFLDRAGGTDA